ncbi:DNA-binding response regulator [Mycobacterium deserti]|nr:response regulator [Mycobacterium deserti]
MHATQRISVALIDDHEVIHAGIAVWLRQADGYIGLVGCYVSIEDYLREHPPGSHGVDVVVVDLELSSRHLDFDHLDALVGVGPRIVVFSHIETDEIILRCLDLGAASYVAKSEGRNHLANAIVAARSDVPYVAPRMAGAMVRDRRVGRPSLPPREREVLIAWFQADSKELVADKLRIAPSTVATHLQRVRAKYAAVGRPAKTKAALVARALQDGIINVDDL